MDRYLPDQDGNYTPDQIAHFARTGYVPPEYGSPELETAAGLSDIYDEAQSKLLYSLNEYAPIVGDTYNWVMDPWRLAQETLENAAQSQYDKGNPLSGMALATVSSLPTMLEETITPYDPINFLGYGALIKPAAKILKTVKKVK